MVTNATNLSRSGLRAWIIQRVSAVILGAFFLFILIYIFCHPGIDYATWKNLFSLTWVRIFTFLALLSMVAHAWIGIWTISTDYITSRMHGSKAVVVRIFFQAIFALLLVIYLVWGVQIIWGL